MILHIQYNNSTKSSIYNTGYVTNINSRLTGIFMKKDSQGKHTKIKKKGKTNRQTNEKEEDGLQNSNCFQ